MHLLTNKNISNLETYTWDQIAEIGAKGEGAKYFNIGDTKTITLNGKVGNLNLDNFTCKVFIIDFNYMNENGIYFQGFKTTNNIDIALCDDNYSMYIMDGNKYFNINHSDKLCDPDIDEFYTILNYGGWKASDLRYDILGSVEIKPTQFKTTTNVDSCASITSIGYDEDVINAAKTSPVPNTLMAALPDDLRKVLASWAIYSDNTGNASNDKSNITMSIDYLPLLSEFEIHGIRTHANEYEQEYQKQMTYYKNNSKIKYNHNDTSKAVNWWLRSTTYHQGYIFCNTNSDGANDFDNVYNSYGLAPAFRVAL